MTDESKPQAVPAWHQRLELDFVKDSWRVFITVQLLCRRRETSPHRKDVDETAEELNTTNDVVEIVEECSATHSSRRRETSPHRTDVDATAEDLTTANDVAEMVTEDSPLILRKRL
ncbi:hypothetical protein LSAT2_006679 [Lamellibrachia satsuma]|nr:hypothetical protein LSAT2_006679 [Lamellibrachia satsuma]